MGREVRLQEAVRNGGPVPRLVLPHRLANALVALPEELIGRSKSRSEILLFDPSVGGSLARPGSPFEAWADLTASHGFLAI